MLCGGLSCTTFSLLVMYVRYLVLKPGQPDLKISSGFYDCRICQKAWRVSSICKFTLSHFGSADGRRAFQCPRHGELLTKLRCCNAQSHGSKQVKSSESILSVPSCRNPRVHIYVYSKTNPYIFCQTKSACLWLCLNYSG